MVVICKCTPPSLSMGQKLAQSARTVPVPIWALYILACPFKNLPCLLTQIQGKFLHNGMQVACKYICWGPTWHSPSAGTGMLQSLSASTGQIHPRRGTTIAQSFRVRCSFRVRHPLLERGTQCQHWVPIAARCQNGDKFAQCQLWAKKVPVPEL